MFLATPDKVLSDFDRVTAEKLLPRCCRIETTERPDTTRISAIQTLYSAMRVSPLPTA